MSNGEEEVAAAGGGVGGRGRDPKSNALTMNMAKLADTVQLAVQLARLDERITAQRELLEDAALARDRALEAAMRATSQALQLARDELTRRLDILNGEQGRIATLTSETVPREVFEAKHLAVSKSLDELRIEFREAKGLNDMRRDLELLRSDFRESKPLNDLREEFKELKGRLWLPMLAAGSVSAAVVAAVMKLVIMP